MEIDLIHTWHAMNTLVRIVVIVLTIQALACIAVTVDRLILLVSSYRKSQKFAAAAGPLLASGQYATVLEIASKHEGSHLATFITTGIRTFLERREQGHARTKAAEHAQRALERQGEKTSLSLNRGMSILASTGSTAPFVGLLGTVLGILNAFRLVGQEGSGGLGTIGAAIAEALIVTGYGLMVAIPAVLIFNWLTGRIGKYEAGLVNAGGELIDALEASGAAPGVSSAGSEEAVTPAESHRMVASVA